MASQREWPRVRPADGTERGSPTGFFQARDGVLRSNRSLAGPLRMGTAPGVGPRGGAVEADYTRDSDFGMDRISPRTFDPIGSDCDRWPSPTSDLVAKQTRK